MDSYMKIWICWLDWLLRNRTQTWNLSHFILTHLMQTPQKPPKNSKWKPATKQLHPTRNSKEFKPRSGRNNQWQVQVWNSQSTTWAHNCKAEKRNKKKIKKQQPDEPTEKTKGRRTSLKRTGGRNPRTLDSFGRPEQKLSDEKQKTA